MKKKLITMILATALTASLLSGCGGKKEEAAAPAETKTEEAAPAEEEAEEVEEEVEETADESADSEGFSLLDVDESMIDVGAYGTNSEGLELVFSMFTGPDGNKYVSLFSATEGGIGVIAGQYEATTEVDEDGDEWTYFDVADVYSGESFKLGVCERPETEEVFFFDENGEVVPGKFLSASETITYMGTAAGLYENN